MHWYPLQELIGHYQKCSLRSVFPEVTTTLKYSYYEIASPPKNKIALPWPISPETPPPAAGVGALDQPGGLFNELHNEVSELVHTYTYIPTCYILLQV